MNDKDLANACVALGVGKLYGPTETQSGGWAPPKDNLTKLVVYTASDFVRDWRVAGELMEKVPRINVDDPLLLVMARAITNSDDNLPRAIIEACVEALS